MSTALQAFCISSEEQGLLRALLDALSGPGHPVTARITIGQEPLEVPPTALELMTRVVEHLAAGRAVAVLGARV